ncbi:MAG TPA: hypothetical protein DDX29_08400 [Clostridiales bacterium]|nr:hypothetical protein [Clostridiales bacterium]
MTQMNLYRFPKDIEKELHSKFQSVSLELVSQKEVENFQFKFYFSKNPDEVDIWWIENYRSFLEEIETPKNQIYFGILLILGKDLLYGLSFGKTHFYLNQFCDTDFGLNLAQRIADKENLIIKNSKFFKSTKSKSITSYHNGSEFVYDSGESIHFLKAKTINPELWGNSASFGTSVKFNVDIEMKNLPSFIEKIENELLTPSKFSIPKVDIVRNEEKIEELDKKLIQSILATERDSEIDVEEFTVSGVNFIFTDADSYNFCVKGKRKSTERIEDLTLDNLIKFIDDKSINLEEDLNNIFVKVHKETGRDYSKSLKNFLDFIDDEERYCLVDGKWYKFNQSYSDYLKNEVDMINMDYEGKFDISQWTNEGSFNKDREANDEFVNCDRDLDKLGKKYKIEKLDLFKGESIYFVKEGKPQKLAYVIDQSKLTVKVLQNNEGKIEIDGIERNVKNIVLWIILDRKNKINKLSEINSMIFHMKLVDWKNLVKQANYVPVVKINYLLPQQK